MDNDQLIKIRRQLDGFIGQVRFSDITGWRWTTVTGGVKAILPQYFVAGYVWCDKIIGHINHSCAHGEGPHSIKILVIKKDNLDIWDIIASKVGDRPIQSRAKPYNPRPDALAIRHALLNSTTHPAIALRSGKFVIYHRNISSLVAGCTENTIRKRHKRLRQAVVKLMKEERGFEETSCGFYLAYKLT